MIKTLTLLWQLKWVTVATLIIELLILLPAYSILYRFGEKSVALNLAVTPIGSTEHITVLTDALINNPAFIYGLLVFLLILPILFLAKLGLAAATMECGQQGKLTLTSWLSKAGHNMFPALGLFARWLIVPVILCGALGMLVSFTDGYLKTGLFVLIAVAWLFSLSWFSHALNFTVLREKKALIKGFVLLKKNLLRFLVTSLFFVTGAAIIKLTSWYYFKSNSVADSNLALAIIGALLLGLTTRFLILFWQTSHVVAWRKIHN